MKRRAYILFAFALTLSMSGLGVIRAQPIAFSSGAVQSVSISTSSSLLSPVEGKSPPQVMLRDQALAQLVDFGAQNLYISTLSALIPQIQNPPPRPVGNVLGIVLPQQFGNPVPMQPFIVSPSPVALTTVPPTAVPPTVVPPTAALETSVPPTVMPPTVVVPTAQAETAPSAPAVIGAFLGSGDPQAQMDALRSVWTPGPYVPLSAGQPIDPLMAGLFAGFDSDQAINTSTPPTFPIVLTDLDTGLSITIDADLGVTIADQTGGVLRDFALFLNLRGEPAAEYRLADGTIDRISIDGYGLTIPPDGQEWIGRMDDQIYAFQLTSEGALVYRDETGAVSVFRVYDTGVLSVELPDGLIAAYIPDNLLDDSIAEDFFLYDAEGNLIEAGDFALLVEAAADLPDDAAISAGDDNNTTTGGDDQPADSAGADAGGDSAGAGDSGGDAGGEAGGDG